MAKKKCFADGGVASLLGSDTPQGATPAANMTVNVTPPAQNASGQTNPFGTTQTLTNQNYNPFSTPTAKTQGTNFKRGGKVRGCGLAQRGKTKGRMV